MRRVRYSIRDFQYIHDVSENNFCDPQYNAVEIRSSLKELSRITDGDA